ncbi:hypothetical protein AAT19DRAFT_8801 [Rhodotorula toruloides]|uniref:EIF3h n=1 Tax=Rhodotorula toruloides TaxID=5286 RepID=A0A2T0AIA5_RHOTO|nr:hypothetical protein AAT19DRAFT_8801 [Rhodotorula toruloides]
MSTAKTLASIAAPAPEVVDEPQVQPKHESKRQKALLDAGLAETRVERVRVDGLALMKIIKHSRESHAVNPAPANTSNATVTFSPAVGQLFGIDSNGTLEVSNAFGLPAGTFGGPPSDGQDESKGVKAATKYTQQLVSRMSDLNADASVVGFYTSTNNGQILATGGFIEALVGAQLSGGGVGSLQRAQPVNRAGVVGQKGPVQLPSGEANKSGKGIALVYDIASATQGAVGLKAYRLSQAFSDAYRSGKFDTASLIQHKLVPTNILEELPVTVHSSALLTAFLSTLTAPTTSSPTSPLSTPHFLPPLALLPPPHLSTLSFQARQLARDRTRLEATHPAVAKRRLENEQRAREGLPPLPMTDEEIRAGLKEPSRLETMCALAAVEGAAKSLSEATGTAIARAYGAKAGVEGAEPASATA